MDTLILPTSSPNPLKRRSSEAGLDKSDIDEVHGTMAMGTQKIFRPASESGAVSSAIPTTIEAAALDHQAFLAAPPAPNPPITTTPGGTNATKKRSKLTASGQEAKRQEKEAKEKEKAEQKVKKEQERIRKEKEKEDDRIRKEQERARKEEEKKARDVERETRRLEKEEQSKLKEERKKKEEAEKNKKQRSQLRLNAFFAPPGLANNGSTPSPTRESMSPTNSRRSSITSIHNHEGLAQERSAPATPSKPRLSDYERRFPTFFLQSHTYLAPRNRFDRDEQGLVCLRKSLDERFASGSVDTDMPAKFNPHRMLRLSPYKRRKLTGHQPSVKEIVEQLHGTASRPVDLTDAQKFQASRQPLELLRSVSTKILKFAEDVRPPYIGTYSRVQGPSAARKLCRNPFRRGLPSTDYDYDSEAEWEDPGEGEDLDSEGEEEAESEDGDDMEGFLDDEEEGTKLGQKRRLVAGDLEPTSTGLCWDNTPHASQDLAVYRLEVILGTPKIPIDPYSTAYWQDEATAPTTTSSLPTQSPMDPPRIPLNNTNRTNLLLSKPPLGPDGLRPPPLNTTATLQPKASQAPKRMVTPEVLDDFKRAVEGSDLTKAGLIEILKKQFPKQSKDAIKDTLGVVAERVGTREKDKRWVVRRSTGV
ncbi:MAG: hypothetical protein Q9208_005243 [Pyrenodesmia sp. 3 TL-2023]